MNQDLVNKAVKILVIGEANHFPVAAAVKFLQDKGLTGEEITAALDIASDCELTRTALGGTE